MKFEDAVQADRKLAIEEKAREDANLADLRYSDEGANFPTSDAKTYWGQVVAEGERKVYGFAYQKRIERRLRTEGIPDAP